MIPSKKKRTKRNVYEFQSEIRRDDANLRLNRRLFKFQIEFIYTLAHFCSFAMDSNRERIYFFVSLNGYNAIVSSDDCADLWTLESNADKCERWKGVFLARDSGDETTNTNKKRKKSERNAFNLNPFETGFPSFDEFIHFIFFIHLWIKYCLMCICVWRRNGLLQMVRLPSFVATRWSRSRGERVRAFVFVCALSLHRRNIIICVCMCVCLHASCRSFNNFYSILMSLFVFWRRRWQMIVTCNAAQTHTRAWNSNLNLNEVQRRARNHKYFWRSDTHENRRRSSTGTSIGVTHNTRTPCHRRRLSPNWMECCLKVINTVVYARCSRVPTMQACRMCVCERACSRAPEDIVVGAREKSIAPSPKINVVHSV